MKKTIYKTIVQVEILSDIQYPEEASLNDIHDAITNGDCSGVIKIISLNEELTGEKAVECVKSQGTDLEFFFMDEEGEELD